MADPIVTVPEGFNVVAARDLLEEAINAVDWIRRLASLTADQFENENVNGQIFTSNAQELCVRHGRLLDRLYSELSGGIRVGTFDHDCFAVD